MAVFGRSLRSRSRRIHPAPFLPFAVSNTAAGVVEAAAGIAATDVLVEEALGGISQSDVAVLDATGSVVRTSALVDEALGGIAITSDHSWPVEELGAVVGTAVEVLEFQAGIAQTVVATILESLAPTSNTDTLRVEAGAGVRSTATSGVEALSSAIISQTVSIPVEAAKAVSIPGFLMFQGAVWPAVVVTIESLLGVQTPATDVPLRAAGAMVDTGGSGANSLSVPLPAGWQPGDLHVLVATMDSATLDFAALAGWTLLIDVASAHSPLRVGVWWRIAQAGDVNPTVAKA